MAELNKVTCGGLLKGNTGVPACYMDLSVINGIIPVSYTHLDVYKRQFVTRLTPSPPYSPAPPPQRGRRSRRRS